LGGQFANLGVQGGAIDWEYEILRHDAVRLHPRYVFIFFFNNDITDLLDRLNDDEMHRFLQLPVSDHTTRYFNLKPASWRGQSEYSMQDLYVDRSYRLLKHLINAWLAEHFKHRHRVPAAAPVSAANAPSPIRVNQDGAGNAAAQPALPTWITQPPFAGDPQMQLALQFHLRALLKAKDFADRHGMRIAYVFIAVPLPYDSLYEKINADYCRANGIDFFSLRPAFDAARRAGVTINLPNDGHLTDAAAAVTARALADHFHLRDASAWR
jgi:hypothetical protein